MKKVLRYLTILFFLLFLVNIFDTKHTLIPKTYAKNIAPYNYLLFASNYKTNTLKLKQILTLDF